ncbi:tetratricopeptide repeat protein [Saccharicrinis aurantiacus]|uniref:tetratricopeptide repeat protein n=1 Tax=Saccharicrinis aurantiacus TaxID=1849719 RepID=UPI0024932771|nr:hypothetical protein [Saccharicrinis aurantiacus]
MCTQKLSFYFLASILIFYSQWVDASNSRREDSLVYKLNNITEKEKSFTLLSELIEHTRTYDPKKAIIFATQGEILAKNKKDNNWLAKFQLEHGNLYYVLSTYDKAIAKYFEASDNFKKSKNNTNLIQCYNNIAMIYDRIGEFNNAIDNYQHAIYQFHVLSDKDKKKLNHFKPKLYNNIASAYNKSNESIKAKEYYNKALEEAYVIKDNSIIGSIYNNLGIIELNENNFIKAKDYFMAAIEVRGKDTISESLSATYNYLANYYILINHFDSAEWATHKSLSISEPQKLQELQKASHYSLFNIYNAKHMYKEALAEHITYKQLSDSIINTQKLARISQLKVAHELEQIEESNKVDKTRIRYRYTILIILLTALLLISILIVRLTKAKQKILNEKYNKLEQDVESKNRELTTNVMLLIQKNQVISDVLKDLKALKGDTRKNNKVTIESIVLNLQSHSNKEIWTEFELRFMQVHSNFYKNLLNAHPDITPTEKRLCALLKLNMTSKEIASITNQSLRSVEVARSRLRKRLGITRQDESLVKYVESF